MARSSKRVNRSEALLIADAFHAVLPRPRKHGTLFIQRYVEEEARKQAYAGPDQDRAYEIICKWADLETQGHLPTFTETSVDLTFLNEVFGEGLGYALKTASPNQYHLDGKWVVPDCGIADGALGRFPGESTPEAVIELKNAETDLDRDKSNGRTAVQQCFDYLIALPECPWGIVSNMSTIRLYHRSRTQRNYEEFTLQELRRRETFNKFYFLFHKGAMLGRIGKRLTPLLELLKQTEERHRTVGDELYNNYRLRRNKLIHHLHKELGKPFDTSVKWAQRLLDRVIFIAFCQHRGLLPARTLKKVAEQPAFTRVTNPQWQSILALFDHVDQGHASIELEIGFNGGLFRREPGLDDLQLPDEPWVNAFTGFGDYDFREGGDVNVDVLGHIFEKSITELEKLRPGGLLAIESADAEDLGGRMPKSAERKKFGIYYTPPAFTGLIVERTVDALIRERLESLAAKFKVDPDTGKDKSDKPSAEYWQHALDMLKDFKICDPACGSGAFLIRAYDAMQHHYGFVVDGLVAASKFKNGTKGQLLQESIPDLILSHNLHGVDVSEQAVEITQLALWIRSARPNRKLTEISENIVWRNSLVFNSSVHERAIDWEKTFPQVFGRKGFDCVIGNPPWEQIMLHDREFFSNTDPRVATAVSAAERERLIARLPKDNPELHAAYEVAQAKADRMLKYARTSGEYPLAGKGRANYYMLFAELAKFIVAPDGLVGLLVPSGIATDDSTKDFFASLMDSHALISLYDFENKAPVFEDVHRSFKFSVLIFSGSRRKTEQADFVFFAHTIEEVGPQNRARHIPLTAADMALLNPNTKTCPIFRTRRDAEITKTIYKRVPILIDENRTTGGNAWGIKFKQGLFNQTSDADKFMPPEKLKAAGLKLDGNTWRKGRRVYLPLYEAKMLQAYDHRAASVMIEAQNWMRQGQTAETTPVQHANPEYAVLPRWWVEEEIVRNELPNPPVAMLGYKRITSATNQRTMIAAMVPPVAAANSTCLMLCGANITLRQTCCLLGNLNSFALDYVARQKTGAVDLNFFIVEQFPILPPDTYVDKCPWSKRETLEHWISERVLKLTCTAEDMIPLAEACKFKGSRGDGVHIWKDTERAVIMAELDAAFFHLYQIDREDAAYILSTFNGIHEPDAALPGQESRAKFILDTYDWLAAGGR